MYRTEIDGLRAFSVILILLYHLNVPGLHGAYVSVDVFFVISGFLISWIIVEDLERGRFSFRTFYYRRVTRIFPTLVTAVGVAMLGAAAVMTPADLVWAGKQALAAVASVSNILYWQSSGYWDPAARDNLFLHTWTLGVEEQFYLFYPLLLFLSYRAGGKRGALCLLLALVAGGVLLTESLVRGHPEAAFYLTPLRLYEFAIGGLGSLAILSEAARQRLQRLAGALSALGAALVIGSMVVMTRDTVFPGLSSVPVCVGTVLLILAGGRGIAAPVLRVPALTWVGRASYSIYLVHWPLIMLHRYLRGPELSPADCALLSAATFALGGLIYHQVDSRLRVRRGDVARGAAFARRRLALIGAVTAAVLVFNIALVASGGWEWRVPESVRYLATRQVGDTWKEKRAYLDAHCRKLDEVFCGERRPGGPNILLLGDSRALDLYIALRTAYPDAGIRLSWANGCPPVFDENVATSLRFPGCPELNRKRLPAALQAPADDIVFLVTHFNGWRRKYVLEAVARFAATGKRVYLVGQSQFTDGQDLLTLAVRHGRLSGLQEALRPYLVKHPFELDGDYAGQVEAAGATFIRSRDFFTDQRGDFRLYTRDGSDLLKYDKVHLTLKGAIEYGQYLARNYPLPAATAAGRVSS